MLTNNVAPAFTVCLDHDSDALYSAPNLPTFAELSMSDDGIVPHVTYLHVSRGGPQTSGFGPIKSLL
jgi:hypothetical protein